MEAYEAFLARHGLLKADAPRVIVTGQMGEPAELIARLEETGNAVYPLRNLQAAIQSGQADSIRPSAVINMAHGRLGDAIVEYLKRQNIPLFSPLNVNRMVDEWEADKMGMNGGFLSQSVVMPEIDGAIRSQVLFGYRLDGEGLQQVHAIPERLDRFVETVNRHIALQRVPNSEKRVAIYYYKGPGQNVLRPRAWRSRHRSTTCSCGFAARVTAWSVSLDARGVGSPHPATGGRFQRLRPRRQGRIPEKGPTGAHLLRGVCRVDR